MAELDLAADQAPAIVKADSRAARGPKRTHDELEFLPALLETIERAPSPTIQWSILVLVALIVGAITWASLAQIDIVAVAPGKVVPIGRIKVVQPLETARIGAIYVEDGQHVDAGDPLIELEAADVTSDIASASEDLMRSELDAEEARLELADTPPRPADFEAPADAPAALVRASVRQAFAERAKLAATIEGYRADIAEKETEIATSRLQGKEAADALPILQQKYDMYNDLYKQGAWQHVDALNAGEQLLQEKAARDTADQDVAGSEAEIRSLETKIAEATAMAEADALDRRAKAEAKAAELTAELAKYRQRLANRHLTASVSGTVENVKVHTLGAVVTVADTLMTIVPDGTKLEVAADIGNDDIGFVTEGQEVELKIEAFPFTRYGLVKGVLTRVSRDATTDKPEVAPPAAPQDGAAGAVAAQAATELAYPAEVALDQDWIATERGVQKLQPGMKVSAEIKTGKRRVIEFLLSPVMTMVREAGRER